MFERTFSFWRRWTGPSHDSSASTATATLEFPADERRLWVRYPVDLKAAIQLTDQPRRDMSAAFVRDISRGGANLLLDREVEPGQLINLELPKSMADGDCTVLACVVRTNAEADGQWAIGCVFSRELTDDDLKRFGAKRERHEDQDQRTWKRFDCRLTAEFERIGDPARRRDTAQVINVSTSGVALLVGCTMEAGALLNLHLIGNDGRTRRTILACVVHVTRRDDDALALGCNFIRELTHEDIENLVHPV